MRRRNRKRWKKAPQARSLDEKCITPWCRNRRALKYTRYKATDGRVVVYEHFLKHCWKCRARQLKERRPVTYVLNMLRHSARKRKLPFTLTVEQFEEFCRRTQYLERRGNKPGCLTIDRKDMNDGYHIGNIRVLEFTENSAQGADNTSRRKRGCIQVTDDNCPF